MTILFYLAELDSLEIPTDDIGIFTTFTDDSICLENRLKQWTAWNSASSAETGNDFEILADHIKFFG